MSAPDESRARTIVQRILYVTVATVGIDGTPWNSPVYASYDERGDFFWSSSPQAEHSRNIEHNGRVFLVIYDSTAPEGTGVGVYVEAAAAALTRPDAIATARRHLALRAAKPFAPERPDPLLESGAQRIYRATPQRVWLNHFENDARGSFLRDIRVELPVGCLAGLVTW